MGYRSRRQAVRLRVAACHERLEEAERSARHRLGGALPYSLETRIARLEPQLATLAGSTTVPSGSSEPAGEEPDLGLLIGEIEAVLATLEALSHGKRRQVGIDEAFVRWARDAFSWRPARPSAKLRMAELSAMLRRLDPDATIGARPGGISLEARLSAHHSPFYFVGQLGTEIVGLLATPVARQPGCFHMRPYRWRRQLQGVSPATLGHDQLDGRFAIESDEAQPLFEGEVDELRDALAALCRFDEPTLHVEGAAATLTWTYDVAYEPLAAATRALAALRRVLSPPPPPAPSRPRPRPTPVMLPAVPARLRQPRR